MTRGPAIKLASTTGADGTAGAGGATAARQRRRPRLRLDNLVRVRHELVKLYRQGRDGDRDMADVSRLANVLSIIGRMIEGGDLERRLEALETGRGRG